MNYSDSQKLVYNPPIFEIVTVELKGSLAVVSPTSFSGFNNDGGNEKHTWFEDFEEFPKF